VDSIVGPGAHIDGDAIVCNLSVVGAGIEVGRGETLDAVKRPEPV
jgi:hypothetical protein